MKKQSHQPSPPPSPAPIEPAAPPQTLDSTTYDNIDPHCPLIGQSFTGLARSMICVDNQTWRNFRIVTVHVENDKVVKTEYSYPYCIWEAIAILEVNNTKSSLNLNGQWQEGKTFSK